MLKREELSRPDSCLNKAGDDELIFVLRAKEPAAVYAVRAWIARRLEMVLNFDDDPKIIDAYEWVRRAEGGVTP